MNQDSCKNWSYIVIAQATCEHGYINTWFVRQLGKTIDQLLTIAYSKHFISLSTPGGLLVHSWHAVSRTLSCLNGSRSSNFCTISLVHHHRTSHLLGFPLVVQHFYKREGKLKGCARTSAGDKVAVYHDPGRHFTAKAKLHSPLKEF